MKNKRNAEHHSPRRRPLRVAEILREEIAQVLSQEMRDPRLQPPWITITEVDVSPDLKNAKVYFSSLAKKPDIDHLQKALQGAGGFIRSSLSKRLEGGYGVPALTFLHDTTIERGSAIDKLIAESVAKKAVD